MGWKEAKQRYLKKPTLSEHGDQDLVARRVLRGLGLVEREIWQTEEALFGHVKDTLELWTRAVQLLQITWQATGCALAKTRLETLVSNPDHKDVLLRLSDIAENDLLFPVYLTRVKGTKVSLAYYTIPADSLHYNVEPPFKVVGELVARKIKHWVVVMETEQFIRQLGPYTWLRKQLGQKP
jgi:hypothetical protein